MATAPDAEKGIDPPPSSPPGIDQDKRARGLADLKLMCTKMAIISAATVLGVVLMCVAVVGGDAPPPFYDHVSKEKTHLSIVRLPCHMAPDLSNSAALEQLAARHVQQPERNYREYASHTRIVRERSSAKRDIEMMLNERTQSVFFHSTDCYSYPDKVSCGLMRNVLNYEAFVYNFVYTDLEEHTYAATGDPEAEIVVVLIEETKPIQFAHWPTQPLYLPWSVECHKEAMQLSKFAGNPATGGKVVKLAGGCGSGPGATTNFATPKFTTRFAQDRCPNLGILTLGWSAESVFGSVAQVQVTIPVQDMQPPKPVDPTALRSEICIVGKGQASLLKKACPARFVDAWVRQKMFTDNCDSMDELGVQFGWRQTCVGDYNMATIATGGNSDNLDNNNPKRNCDLQDGAAFPSTATYPYVPPVSNFPLVWSNPDGSGGKSGALPFFRQADETCDLVPAGFIARYGGIRVFDVCGNVAREQPVVTLYFVTQQEACPPNVAQVPLEYIVHE